VYRIAGIFRLHKHYKLFPADKITALKDHYKHSVECASKHSGWVMQVFETPEKFEEVLTSLTAPPAIPVISKTGSNLK